MSEFTNRPDDPLLRPADAPSTDHSPQRDVAGSDETREQHSAGDNDQDAPTETVSNAEDADSIWFTALTPVETGGEPDPGDPIWTELPSLPDETGDRSDAYFVLPDQQFDTQPPEPADDRQPSGEGDSPAVDTSAQATHTPETAARDDASRQNDIAPFSPADLTPTGRTPTGDTRELMTGPDGREHFVGDSPDTFRDSTGDLHLPNGRFVRDRNKPTDIVEETPADSLTLLPARNDPDARPFLDGAADNVVAASVKDTIRTTKIDPLLDRMADAGLPADAKVFASSEPKYAAFLEKASEVLTDADLAEIDTVRTEYRDADKRLKASSERLGQLAGDYVTAKLFPDAIVVTGGKDEKGRPAEFDRVLLIGGDKPQALVIEEKGETSKLGTRDVTNPADPTGPRATARQCSPEYVREILHIDATLAKAVRANPELGRALQQTVTGANGGELRCYLVNGQSNGKIKVTQMLLAPLRLLRESIRLAGYQREGDQR